MLSVTKQQVTRSIENFLDKASKTYSASDVDPLRYWTLRPSGFPYCGLRKLLSAAEDLETPRLEQLSSSYFTSVGTTTHEVFQRFGGMTGSVLGNWKCRYKKCGFTQRVTTYSRCPKCQSDVDYQELEVVFKKTVIGHIDGVIRLMPNKGEKSPHVLLDYKTTSLKKINMSRSPFPYGGNVAQIEKYVPLAEDQYGISIDWWVLIYLARDAPFRYGRKIITHHLTKKEKDKHRQILQRWVKVHRHVLVSESKEDFEYVRKFKFCSSEEDYNKRYRDEYSECPYKDKCFDRGLLTDLIEQKRKHKVYPLINHVPDYVKKVMEIQ